jgi:hypothetical protein
MFNLSGKVPEYGLLTFELGSLLDDSGAIIILHDTIGIVNAISYGTQSGQYIPWADAPGSDQSIIVSGQNLELTVDITK